MYKKVDPSSDNKTMKANQITNSLKSMNFFFLKQEIDYLIINA